MNISKRKHKKNKKKEKKNMYERQLTSIYTVPPFVLKIMLSTCGIVSFCEKLL